MGMMHDTCDNIKGQMINQNWQMRNARYWMTLNDSNEMQWGWIFAAHDDHTTDQSRRICQRRPPWQPWRTRRPPRPLNNDLDIDVDVNLVFDLDVLLMLMFGFSCIVYHVFLFYHCYILDYNLYITTVHALFFTIHYVCNIVFDNHSMIIIIVIIIFSSCFCLLWFFCVIILQIVSSLSSALMSPFSLGNIYRMKRKMVWLSPHTHINAEFAVTISRSNLLVHQTFRRQTKNTWCTKLALIIQQESSFGWPFFLLLLFKGYTLQNHQSLNRSFCMLRHQPLHSSFNQFPPPLYC